MNRAEKPPIERDSKRFTVHRLEQALQAWEDRMAYFRGYAKVEELLIRQGVRKERTFLLNGSLIHYGQLRSHLLSLKDPRDFNETQFATRFSLAHNKNNNAFPLDIDAVFPRYLAQWTTESRRVYHLDPDLQLGLLTTGLGTIRWEDVTFPFDSFGVSLELPFKHTAKDRNYEFDFLLFNHFPKTKEDPEGIVISAFHRSLDTFQKRNPIVWKKVERALERGDADRALHLLKLQDSEILSTLGSRAVVHFNGSRIEDDIADDSTFLTHCKRLLAGLALYLDTIPSKKKNITPQWVSANRGTRDLNAITNESEVCTVSTSFVVTSEERETGKKILNRERGYELSAGFRRSHWRKPPYTAHNPDEPQSVRVRSARIRHDRLPEAGLPGGATVELK